MDDNLKMQLKFLRALIGMFVQQIVRELFSDETGAARLQQIGLFTLIFVLEENGVPVTAKRLSQMTGQPASAVHKQLQRLEELGVITREKALNVRGRGRALHLKIRHTKETERLLKAMCKAAGKRKR